MAIQSEAGLGVSTGIDDVLQNGDLSVGSLAQALKAARDYLDARNAQGLSVTDLNYVQLSTAISSLVELWEQVARKQEQQMEIFKFKRSDVRHEPVNGVCDNLSQLGYDLDSLNQMVSHINGKIIKSDEKQRLYSQLSYDLDLLNQMVSGMNGKIMTSDEKQDPTNLGVWHFCNKADGHKISGKAQGPKALADNSFPEDGSVKSDNQRRWRNSYPRIVTRRNTVMKQFLKETEDNAKSCNRNYNLH